MNYDHSYPLTNWQEVKKDCFRFKGHIPCLPNKEKGYTCVACPAYQPISKRILLIKLGAIGDVIRTTPLLRKYRELYPNCHITWITDYPEVLSEKWVERMATINCREIAAILDIKYDIAINLDKEPEACMLLKTAKASKKYGFTWDEDGIAPATPAAEHKLLTGLFDEYSRQNTASYPEEIFAICHLKFSGEKYLLPAPAAPATHWEPIVKAKAKDIPVVGLNTGYGKRWPTRQWPDQHWKILIRLLQEKGYFCLLLGGKDEDLTNQRLSEATGAWYAGHYPIAKFIELMSHCDLVVTQVTMAMHICLGLGRKLVLMNNIFNPHEFELYGLGKIVQPSTTCDCFFGATCMHGASCMQYLDPGIVAETVGQLLPVKQQKEVSHS